MARPKGSPKVGGRKKGTPNKATDLRTAAKAYTHEALETLAGIMRNTQAPEAARVAASDKLLDRGWGKPSQPLDGDGQGGAIKTEATVIVLPSNGR